MIRRPAIKNHGGVKRTHIPIEPEHPCLNTWEQAETINRMLRHGFDNVRGWEFTENALKKLADLEMIKKLAFGKMQLCRTYGNDGHMASQCMKRARGEQAMWLISINRRIAQL